MSMRDVLVRFHAAITGAAPLESAKDLVERGDIDELARLGIYAHAYTARIADALVHDYPKLVSVFDLRGVTADYLRAYPPSQPSLREVGAHLARFLDERGMARHLGDLARLERARVEVFDGEDAAPLSRDDLAALDPVEFPALHLRLVPSSRIVAMTTNADDLWGALEDSREAPAPADATRVVLVWRREYTVVHRTLEADEASVASALAAGTSFGELCEQLDAPAERAIALLVRWLDAQCLQR